MLHALKVIHKSCKHTVYGTVVIFLKQHGVDSWQRVPANHIALYIICPQVKS